MNIAVTGGMGSGKSMASIELSKLLGAELVNVDRVCQTLLQPGGKGMEALQQVASAACFKDDGSLNRPVLREALFEDESLRKQVDSVIHPLVRKEVLCHCKKAKKEMNPLVVEIPLLFETGWQKDFDCTLLVYASEEICVKRIMQRDLVNEKAALLSVAAQIPIQEKVQLADFLIDNNGTTAETRDQIEYLVESDCFAEKTTMTMNNT